MYTCPNCHSHRVTVERPAVLIEHWDGDERVVEDDFDEEAGPDSGSIVCRDCEEQSDYAADWWAPF